MAGSWPGEEPSGSGSPSVKIIESPAVGKGGHRQRFVPGGYAGGVCEIPLKTPQVERRFAEL